MTTSPIDLTTQIVCSYVGNNPLPPDKLGQLIKDVHGALAVESNEPTNLGTLRPAVPIKRSVQHDHIVCLEDGKHLKMLKRYIKARYDLTPEQYRAKWGLPADYPMTAPAYSEQRSAIAKEIGLGQRSAPPRRAALASKNVSRRSRKL